MPGLSLRVLGNLEVIRDGEVLELPPSRKTRGLLAYLALSDKPRRREQLCELLWEIPDDPRGSLRWSLSKIRKLVDDADRPRIIADRSNVAFNTSGVDIDVRALHAAADTVEGASVDELVRMAEQNQGAFLEGLDLPDFHDYHAWYIGERERTIRSQAGVLRELGKRLADQPEQALDYALSLVSLTPFDESPRAELIRLLVQLDRQQEAEHQFRVGVEKLAEVGVEESGALASALRQRSGRVVSGQPEAAGSAPQRAVGERANVAGQSATPWRDNTLIGRDEETATLQALIHDLPTQDRAQVLLIRGEPGMGKSRLLRAAAAMGRQAGAGLLKASAFESEMIRPFGVWNDALKRALPDNRTSRLLSSGQQVSREQVFDSLVEVLAEEAAHHPVLVLCDDVQWADESSVSAMHHVMRTQPHQPLLVIAAAREVELRENASVQQVLRSLRASGLLREMYLEPLDEAQIEALVSASFPRAAGEALGRQSGGNPLLALELARAGLEGAAQERAAQERAAPERAAQERAAQDRGGSLAELVEDRMGRFGDEARSILQWAAVLTPRINVHCLERVSNLPQATIEEALQQAEEQGLLHPGERGMRFAHELIRKSVYLSISPPQRRSMHRRVAQLLEKDTSVDLDKAVDLSHHARRSEDPQMAGKAMVSAGKLCLRFYANEDAMALYREGMEFAAQLSDAQRVCLALELGEIRMNAQQEEDWEGLVDEFVVLAEQAMDHGSRAHARLGYQMASYLRWIHGELRGAKRFSLQAERISRGASDEAQVLGLAEAAKCLALLERDLSRAEAMTMEAGSLAQRVGYECPAIPITLGILRYHGSQFDQAVEYLEDARAMAKSSGDRLTEYMANEYLTIVEMERRDCAAAHDHASALVDIGVRIREGSERPFAESLQAVCHFGLSGDDSGLASSLVELRHADAKQRLSFVLNRAAIQYLEHAQLERGSECAREALELARVMERPSEILQALVSLERVHRADPALEPSSYREQIDQAAAGGMAGWVRKRCDELMMEFE